MEITERDLEDLIFNDVLLNRGDLLKERGLELQILTDPFARSYWHRQLALGDYGICDIVGYSRYRGSIYVDLLELKNRPLQPDDFNQVLRYRTAINEMLHNSFSDNTSFYINTYLVGPSFGDGHYIHNHVRTKIYTFDFGITGFTFRHHVNSWINVKSKNLHFRHLRFNNLITVDRDLEINLEEVDNG